MENKNDTWTRKKFLEINNLSSMLVGDFKDMLALTALDFMEDNHDIAMEIGTSIDRLKRKWSSKKDGNVYYEANEKTGAKKYNFTEENEISCEDAITEYLKGTVVVKLVEPTTDDRRAKYLPLPFRRLKGIIFTCELLIQEPVINSGGFGSSLTGQA